MKDIPTTTPEKREILDDNARKFTLEELETSFLNEHAAISFVLTTDWLVTDEDKEEKVAVKDYGNGNIQMLLIKKVTDENGDRKTDKKKITEEEYERCKSDAILQVVKTRHEFKFVQNGNEFNMKYDEFHDSDIRVLEVDATNDEIRAAFNPNEFPVASTEVTGNRDYYGYRIATVLSRTRSA